IRLRFLAASPAITVITVMIASTIYHLSAANTHLRISPMANSCITILTEAISNCLSSFNRNSTEISPLARISIAARPISPTDISIYSRFMRALPLLIGREATALHLPQTIAHAGLLLFIVADPQRRGLLIVHAHPVLYQLFHQLRRELIQRRGGLVQQQKIGILLQYAQQANQLLLSAG